MPLHDLQRAVPDLYGCPAFPGCTTQMLGQIHPFLLEEARTVDQPWLDNGNGISGKVSNADHTLLTCRATEMGLQIYIHNASSSSQVRHGKLTAVV